MNIVDEFDPCRSCRGTGNGPRELQQTGAWLSLKCHACNGTGSKTVLVTPPAPTPDRQDAT